MAPSLLLYRRLLRYVRPYWWAFALAIVGMVIVATGDQAALVRARGALVATAIAEYFRRRGVARTGIKDSGGFL